MSEKRKHESYRRIHAVIGILLLLLLALLLALFGMRCYHYAYELFADEPYSLTGGEEKSSIIYVEDGDTVADIADRLEEAEIIESAWLFRLRMKVEGIDGELAVGTHRVSSTMTGAEIVKEFFKEVSEDEDAEDTSDT